MSNAAPPDLESAPAHVLVAALAARRISAREACEAAIARIERLDGAINAVVVRDFERARMQAAACDEALARGERRPLLGVPMTVKESFDVAGLPTTWGLPHLREFRPAVDAVAVMRLKSAGAVILGKTNVPPALGDWQSTNPIYGRTVNPHDPARSPGGSSGGAAAALASGMVALELGSDIGGSIRVPAHFCGVFGHKPSFGLVPTRGHGFPGVDGAPVDLAVCGPLARSAADLELALGVLAGPDADEAAGYRVALPAPRPRRLADCRFLVLDTHPSACTDAVMRTTMERLGADLARAGAHVARATPLLPDLAAAHGAYLKMLNTITSRGAPGAQAVLSAHAWLDLVDQRARLRRAWHALFEQFDVVVAPPFGTVAYPHVDEPEMKKRTLAIDGVQTPYGDQLAWPGVATLPGLPATVAPVGKTAAGLPIGVQAIGPYLHDLTTIAVASWLHGLTATEAAA
ncbi:MAG: amidase family protein [Caldimonas sp.]